MNEALIQHALALIDHAERLEIGAVVLLCDAGDEDIESIHTDARLSLGAVFGAVAAMLQEDGYEDQAIREALDAALGTAGEEEEEDE